MSTKITLTFLTVSVISYTNSAMVESAMKEAIPTNELNKFNNSLLQSCLLRQKAPLLL